MEKEYFYIVDSEKLNKVLKDPIIASGTKVVLWALIRRLGFKEYTFVSQKTIGDDIGLKPRMIRQHIKILKIKGIIILKKGGINSITNRGYRSNTAFLTPILKRKQRGNKMPKLN